ncbi:uncharacterized protein DMAD_06180 [Drosophila madeirensis]|uniref:Uncharacterized protein n=1 Tax=Drosophila madeirensis TaxID=30013 RepID=A0AAU9FR73_DROMD
MAPNKNISYGVGAKTNCASPFRRNVNNERGRTRRASPIIYPESVLTRASTSQPQTRNRIGMQLLRDLVQTLPTTPSRISPATSGSRRLRPRISRAGQLSPSQMVLNRPMPMQSRTALGVVPVPQGIAVREVSAKESSRRVRIKNQDKEAEERKPSVSMTNISTARKSPMQKASTMSQQYVRSPLTPVIMVDAQEDPDVNREDTEPQDTIDTDNKPTDGIVDENLSITPAAQEDEVEHRLSGDSAASEDKEPASVATSPQAEEVEPTAGVEEQTEATASCQQGMKIFPCFRGEYPTRNRAAPYQWFEKTGFNPGGIAPGAGTCKLVESGQNPGEENILTTCEVTEEHFMSIGCECDEKPLWQEAPHFMGCLSGEQGQQMPQQQGRPYCREQQQLPRCMQQQLPRCMQQQQAAMFRSYPNMYGQQQHPSCCGLTEMLAQQLHQKMQEAQAQIAQVQLQLKNACGSTQVQQINMNDNCSSEDPYWPGEDLDERVSVGGEETDYATEQSMNISCSAMYQEEEQQKAPQNTASCVMMPCRSCPPPSQPPPCYAAPCQQQQQQQAKIPCQQRLSSQQQQQQQKCFPEPFPCQQQQQSPPPPHQKPAPAPFQQQPPPPPPSCQMQQQQQLLMHILQQQQKLLLQQQEQKQQPPKQQQNPRQHPQQQQHSMQRPKLFQQHHQSQHNMCPHLSHWCPSCYCQRYAKMRFMMPRRWPC